MNFLPPAAWIAPWTLHTLAAKLISLCLTKCVESSAVDLVLLSNSGVQQRTVTVDYVVLKKMLGPFWATTQREMSLS